MEVCFRAGTSQLMYCRGHLWRNTFTFLNHHFYTESWCSPLLTVCLVSGLFSIWFLTSVMISIARFYSENPHTIDTFDVQLIVPWYILPWSIYYATFNRSSCCHCNALEGYFCLLFLPTAHYECFAVSHFFIESSLEALSTLLLPLLALKC